jgi:hypothetical protein
MDLLSMDMANSLFRQYFTALHATRRGTLTARRPAMQLAYGVYWLRE